MPEKNKLNIRYFFSTFVFFFLFFFNKVDIRFHLRFQVIKYIYCTEAPYKFCHGTILSPRPRNSKHGISIPPGIPPAPLAAPPSREAGIIIIVRVMAMLPANAAFIIFSLSSSAWMVPLNARITYVLNRY